MHSLWPQCMDVKKRAQVGQRVHLRTTDAHDEQSSGRPSVSAETIAEVEPEMLEDQCVTVRELCERIPEVSKSGRRIL